MSGRQGQAINKQAIRGKSKVLIQITGTGQNYVKVKNMYKQYERLGNENKRSQQCYANWQSLSLYYIHCG